MGIVYLFLQKLGLQNDKSYISMLVLPMPEEKKALTFLERLARSSVSVLSSSVCCALMSLRGSIKKLWFEGFEGGIMLRTSIVKQVRWLRNSRLADALVHLDIVASGNRIELTRGQFEDPLFSRLGRDLTVDLVQTSLGDHSLEKEGKNGRKI